MIWKNKIVMFVAVLLVIAMLPLAFACAPKAAPPAALKSITYWTIADMSGPYATIMAPLRPALDDCMEYINTELGGINGVPLKYDIKDNGNKMDVCLAQYEELRTMTPKPLVTAGWVAGQSEALKDRLAEDKIPLICTVSAKAIYPPAYSFGFNATYIDTFGGFLDWLLENWKEKRPPKVAILTWDTALGKGCVTDEGYAYAKAKGIDIVATELFKMTDMNVSTQLLRIKDSNPDWIYTNTLTTGPVTILKSAKDIGYKFNFAGCYSIGWDAIKLGGAELFEGTIIVKNEASWDDTANPGIQKLTKIFAAHNRTDKERDQVYTYAWNYTMLGAEALRKAVDEVGWDKLTGEAVKNQFTKIKNYAPLGGLGYFTFTEDIRATRTMYVAKVQGGKIVPITKWREVPDLRPGGSWTPKK